MRRVVVVLMLALAALIAIAGPASACRIVQDSYGTPAIGQGDVGSLCLGGNPPLDSCAVFPVMVGETVAHIEITDASGTQPYGTVGQDYNDDGLSDVSRHFCGSTTGFPLEPPALGAYEIIVFPHMLGGLGNDPLSSPEACMGAATSGIVTVTFC